MAFTVEDIKKLEPQIRGIVADSSIGFCKFFPNDEDCILAGTGTLISCGTVRGVLTADHVLRNLPNSGEVGIVATSSRDVQINRLTLNMQHASKITVGRCSNTARGPDLGVLILPQPIVAKLESIGKPFYNLSLRREKMLDMSARKPGVWVFSGMVHEWTEDRPSNREFKRVKVFRGICVIFNVAPVREEGGFDYMSIKLKYWPDVRYPESYEGCSGGGIWQILIREDRGQIAISELLLSGVAFFEHPLDQIGMEIECHGIKSIYEKAVEALTL
jgi:hypothetical protein